MLNTRAQAVVVVFKMKGCPACSDYIPRLKRLSAKFPNVPLFVLDIADPQYQAMADKYQVTNLPCTMVLTRSGRGAFKASGSIASSDIEKVLHHASKAS